MFNHGEKTVKTLPTKDTLIVVKKDSIFSDTLCPDCAFTVQTVKEATELTVNKLDSIRFDLDRKTYELGVQDSLITSELKMGKKSYDLLHRKRIKLNKFIAEIDSILSTPIIDTSRNVSH